MLQPAANAQKKKFLIPTQVDLALRITVGCRFDRLLSITYSCIFRHSKSSFAGKIYATCKGGKKEHGNSKNEYKSVKLQFSCINENWSFEDFQLFFL